MSAKSKLPDLNSRNERTTALIDKDATPEEIELLLKTLEYSKGSRLGLVTINRLANHKNIPQGPVVLAIFRRLGLEDLELDNLSKNLEGNQINKLERHYRGLLLSLERMASSKPDSMERRFNQIFSRLLLTHFEGEASRETFTNFANTLRVWNGLSGENKNRLLISWGLHEDDPDYPLFPPDQVENRTPPKLINQVYENVLKDFHSNLSQHLGVQDNYEAVSQIPRLLENAEDRTFLTDLALLRLQCLQAGGGKGDGVKGRGDYACETIQKIATAFVIAGGSRIGWQAWRYDNDLAEKQLSLLERSQIEEWKQNRAWSVHLEGQIYHVVETDDPHRLLYRGNNPTLNCFDARCGVNNTELPGLLADAHKKALEVFTPNGQLIGRTTMRLVDYTIEGDAVKSALLIDPAETEKPDRLDDAIPLRKHVQQAAYQAAYAKVEKLGMPSLSVFSTKRVQPGYKEEADPTRDWEKLTASVRVPESHNNFDNLGYLGEIDCFDVGFPKETRNGGFRKPGVPLKILPFSLADSISCEETLHPDIEKEKGLPYVQKISRIFPDSEQLKAFWKRHQDKGEFIVAGDLSNLPQTEAATWRQLILIDPRVLEYINPKTIKEIVRRNDNQPLKIEEQGRDLRIALALINTAKEYGQQMVNLQLPEDDRLELIEKLIAEGIVDQQQHEKEIKRQTHLLRETLKETAKEITRSFNINPLGERTLTDYNFSGPSLSDYDKQIPPRRELIQNFRSIVPDLDYKRIVDVALKEAILSYKIPHGETIQDVLETRRDRITAIFNAGELDSSQPLTVITSRHGGRRVGERELTVRDFIEGSAKPESLLPKVY